MNLKEFGRIEGYENRLIRQWPHLAVSHPEHGRRRSAHLMRNPGKRRADQSVLVRIPVRMSVKGSLLNEGYGRRRDEMSLLIGGHDLIGNGIIAQVGLAKALGQTGDSAAIRRNSQNGARGATDGAPGLTGLANEKASVLHHHEGGREFPGLGSLVDLRAKELVVVRFAIAIPVMKAPEPVPVEVEIFLVAQALAKWFVQTGCKAGPLHFLGTGA